MRSRPTALPLEWPNLPVSAAREEGVKVGLIRLITLWPFPKKEFSDAQRLGGVLCVELSMGQMVEDVRLAINGRCPVEFVGRTGDWCLVRTRCWLLFAKWPAFHK